MDKIRKKKSDDSGTAQDWLSTIFLLYMGTLYPLIMHDKYFDITLTKYKAFEVALCVYAVLMVLAVLLDVFDGKKPFGFLKSCVSFLLRPKVTYAGKAVKLEKEVFSEPVTAVRSVMYVPD